MSVDAWESANSQFHARRRACLAGRASLPDRLAVLLVDSPQDTAKLTTALAGQPFEVSAVADPAEALLRIGRTCPDVVLVGPRDGVIPVRTFVQILRDCEPDLPLVVGIGRADGELAGEAAVRGATVTAHPFPPEHLLRLLTTLAPPARLVEVRPLAIDLGRLRVDGAAPQMWLDGSPQPLPMREYLLLRYFAERVGTVLSHAEIMRAVWGEVGVKGHSTLTVHVMRLRRRLGDTETAPQWIRAVRGLGYQFIVPSSSQGSSDT